RAPQHHCVPPSHAHTVSAPCPALSFLTPPRPPTPTLFPYTTLFRSHRRVIPSPAIPSRRRRSTTTAGTAVPNTRTPSRRKAPSRDRKSTRLNSSHVSISYAVFCLKKKKHHR